MARPASSSPRERPGNIEPGPIAARTWLWPGLFLAPMVFLAYLTVAYALVTAACNTQQHWLLDASSVAAMAVSAWCTWMSARDWRTLGTAVPGDQGDPLTARRFLAITGLLLSSLMTLVIVAQWLTRLAVPPCAQ
jgi:uncharacterized membrane protein